MNKEAEQKIKNTLVPSLPARSFSQLQLLAEALDGVADGFQIDIVDGKFVPHTAWPFTEEVVENEWEKVMKLPQSFKYELDCMIMEPEKYLDIFKTLPLQKLIIHAGSTTAYGELIRFAKANDFQIGIAFTNDVPLSFLEPYIPMIDFVQIMGIAKIGVQGQPFDERTLKSASSLRGIYPELSIAVDGSVNAKTIPSLLAAGVNHFAPGSAISKAEDPVVAYKQLTSLIE